MILQEFNLDLFPGRQPPVVHVSQNDHGTQRKLRAYLFLNGEPYTPPAGTTATVEGSDLLGRGFDAVECTVGSGWVQFALTERMTCDAGPIRCKIELTLGTTVIGTGAFMLARDAAGVTIETILNDESFIEKLAAALGLVIGQEADVIADATRGWLDRHPEATTTVQDGAITYAKMADGERIEENGYKLDVIRRKVAVLVGTVRNNTLARKRYNSGHVRINLVRDLDLCGVNYHVAVDRWGKNTANTPYSSTPRRTKFTGGICITYKNGDRYGTQLVLPNGSDEVIRRQLYRGEWKPWIVMRSETTIAEMADDFDTEAEKFPYAVHTFRWSTVDGVGTLHSPVGSGTGSGFGISFYTGAIGSQVAFRSGSNAIYRRYKQREDEDWSAWTTVAGGS